MPLAALSPVSLGASEVDSPVYLYPEIPDHELIDDFKFLAQLTWEKDLATFAQDGFPSHLRLMMPAYHHTIYTALQQLLNAGYNNSHSHNQASVKLNNKEINAGVGAEPERGAGTPPGEFGEGISPTQKSLTKSKNRASKSSKKIVKAESSSQLTKYTSNNQPSEREDNQRGSSTEVTEGATQTITSGNKNLAIVEPREFGKSTKAMVFVMSGLLNRRKKFILYISKSYEHAVKLVGPIKAEFESNEDLQMVYGNVRGNKWTEGEMEFKFADGSAKLLAVGRGQSVRGLKYLNWRPDLIILDDIEDDKEVENNELRQELQMWLDRQVMPGVDSASGNIVAFGTILHPDSLLANLVKPKDRLLKYSTFDTLFFGALDSDDKSIWEEKFSTSRLLEERRLDPFKFAQERMNQPIPLGSGMFKSSYFKYFTIEEDGLHQGERVIPITDCNLYLTCDIAMTEKSYSDYTVLMITAVSPDNEFFVLEYTRQKWEDPDKILDELFRLNAKYPDIKMNGIEAVAAQKWLIVNLKKEMKRRNVMTIRFCELKADTDKLRRISQLQPRFAADGIFIRNHMGTLEEELLLFPKSPHDDLSDALAYVPYLAKPGEKVEPIRSRIRPTYTFSVDADTVLTQLMEKGKAKGALKEYANTDKDDEFNQDEFEEVMIQKWNQED